jgi:EmrB/QacA subfamily drug resistance transporter
MIMPLTQIIMADAAGPKQMGRVMGIAAIPFMLAPMFGPLLGGVIIQALSWHWIFYVNVVVALFAVPLAIRLLPANVAAKTDRLDFLGLALMSTGLVAITYGLAEAGTYSSFGNPHVWAPVVAGVVLVAAFAFHALRIRNPLLDLRLYRNRHFTAASIVMFTLGGALYGGMILLPLYWQELRHYDVIETGLLTVPASVGTIITMPLASRLAERFGGGPVALVGVIGSAITTIPFALIGAHTSIATLTVENFIRGFAMGATFMPAMTAAFAALDRSQITHATPQLNVLSRVGGSIGTTIVAVVVATAERHNHTPTGIAHAYGLAFWWAVGLSALGVIPCIVLMRAESQARKAALVAGEADPDRVAIDSGAVAEALA